eukprot:GHVU01021230.1.p1 GENE.GHVU01021230.1~~GHVU01021230.1.p1  ORF type:complete len:246 (+),score=72.24 GHVU01021230.1:169-906(+)
MTTNYKEEQAMEIEALESMYTPEEFTKLSDASMRIRNCSGVEGPKARAFDLFIEYPETYPDVPPIWRLENLVNTDDESRAELEKEISAALDENLGMPVVFQLVDVAHTWLASNPEATAKAKAKAKGRAGKDDGDSDDDDDDSSFNPDDDDDDDSDDESLGEEDEELAGLTFKGLEEKTLCNPDVRATEEQFEQWRVRFEEEMIKKGVWPNQKSGGKLTGKDFFETNCAAATAEMSFEDAFLGDEE